METYHMDILGTWFPLKFCYPALLSNYFSTYPQRQKIRSIVHAKFGDGTLFLNLFFVLEKLNISRT